MITEKILIDKCLLHLALEEGAYNSFEVVWITLLDEQIQLMAKILRVILVLLISCKRTVSPFSNEGVELRVLNVMMASFELVDFFKDFIDFQHIVNDSDF